MLENTTGTMVELMDTTTMTGAKLELNPQEQAFYQAQLARELEIIEAANAAGAAELSRVYNNLSSRLSRQGSDAYGRKLDSKTLGGKRTWQITMAAMQHAMAKLRTYKANAAGSSGSSASTGLVRQVCGKLAIELTVEEIKALPLFVLRAVKDDIASIKSRSELPEDLQKCTVLSTAATDTIRYKSVFAQATYAARIDGSLAKKSKQELLDIISQFN